MNEIDEMPAKYLLEIAGAVAVEIAAATPVGLDPEKFFEQHAYRLLDEAKARVVVLDAMTAAFGERMLDKIMAGGSA